MQMEMPAVNAPFALASVPQTRMLMNAAALVSLIYLAPDGLEILDSGGD